jgi:hypothetical protein
MFSSGIQGHAYVAAYSMNDAVRVITEVLGYEPRGIRSELKIYWSRGCWGTPMDGITPERGMWVQQGYNFKPVKLERKE